MRKVFGIVTTVAQIVFYGLVLAVPMALASACPTEDSTWAPIGVPACVWFAPVQGNGKGETRINTIWMD